MGRSSRSVVSSHAFGVRDEAAEAWDHLVAAVLEGATDVGERSRRAGATARDRAASAVRSGCTGCDGRHGREDTCPAVRGSLARAIS